jgi:hypothetical protein
MKLFLERKGLLISPQKPIQFGFQGTPSAADFDGFNAALANVFEVGGAGNLEVFTGLFGGINDLLAVFIKSIGVAPIAPVNSAAAVGFFAPILTASALHYVIIYHKYHLIINSYAKTPFEPELVSANHLFFFINFL